MVMNVGQVKKALDEFEDETLVYMTVNGYGLCIPVGSVQDGSEDSFSEDQGNELDESHAVISFEVQ